MCVFHYDRCAADSRLAPAATGIRFAETVLPVTGQVPIGPVGAGLPRERPVQPTEQVLTGLWIAGQARSYRSNRHLPGDGQDGLCKPDPRSRWRQPAIGRVAVVMEHAHNATSLCNLS